MKSGVCFLILSLASGVFGAGTLPAQTSLTRVHSQVPPRLRQSTVLPRRPPRSSRLISHAYQGEFRPTGLVIPEPPYVPRQQDFVWHPLRTDDALIKAARVLDIRSLRSIISKAKKGSMAPSDTARYSAALYAFIASVQDSPPPKQAHIVTGLRLLLDAGADINIEFFGKTPLQVYCASPFPNLQALKMMLEHGAHVDAVDEHGYTPLMWTSLFNDSRAVKLLLKHGADPNRKNYLGQTPIDLALSLTDDGNAAENLRTIAALLDAGADEFAAMGLRSNK